MTVKDTKDKIDTKEHSTNIGKITLGKKEITHKLIEKVSRIAELTYIKNKHVSIIFNVFLDLLVDCVSKGYNIKINGYLKVQLKRKLARLVRNPRLNINTTIESRIVAICKAGSKIAQAASKFPISDIKKK